MRFGTAAVSSSINLALVEGKKFDTPVTLLPGRAKLPTITIAPGVTATLGWGRGALVERLDMQPNAAYPSQTLNEELFVIVQDGSATIEIHGRPRAALRPQLHGGTGHRG